MINRSDMLRVLPPFQGREDLINADQTVKDIQREVLDAHEVFARDYDKLVPLWAKVRPADLLFTLYGFCKRNLPYVEEDETDQTTRSPAGILTLPCDCKHYAGFLAGVLDALNRAGKGDWHWCYRFASYDFLKFKPGHVFVVVADPESDPDDPTVWIDPVPDVPTFNSRIPYPAYKWDKSPSMALYRLSGVGTKIAGFMHVKTVNRHCAGSCRSGRIGCACDAAPAQTISGRRSIGVSASMTKNLFDALKQYEMNLISSVQALRQSGAVDTGILNIAQNAAASGVPGATQAAGLANLVVQGLTAAAGPGSALTRAATDAFKSGALGPFIVAKDLISGRNYNTDQYHGASDWFFYVQGVDKGATTNIADGDVPPALMWFISKLGVFVSGSAHINALRQSAEAYLALYAQNNYTTTDTVRVGYAAQVVQQYMLYNYVKKGWAGTVGVYDNAVTAAIFQADIGSGPASGSATPSPAAGGFKLTTLIQANPLATLIGLVVAGGIGYELLTD